jgi:hypothetical protein
MELIMENYCPSKLRIFFFWRLAEQSLPTTNVLKHRNTCLDRAHVASVELKDSWKHSLVECKMANSDWVLSDDLMVEHMIACGQASAENWMFHLMETLPHDQFTRLSVTFIGYMDA